MFAEVSKTRADYGVVPVENTTEGVVTHTLDMFVDSDLKIVSQIVLPIQYCLAGNGKGEEIQTALCASAGPGPVPVLGAEKSAAGRKFLRPPPTRARPSWWLIPTARNTQGCAGKRRPSRASSPPKNTACDLLEQDIQDNAANATRFLVLGRQCSPPTGDDRTSLMISVADKSGALHEAIAAFRRYKINMTKIESRPSKRKAWEYFFFIDCDGHVQDRKVVKAIQDSWPSIATSSKSSVPIRTRNSFNPSIDVTPLELGVKRV